MEEKILEYAPYIVKGEGITDNGSVVKFCIKTDQILKKGDSLYTEIDGNKEMVVVNSYKYYKAGDINNYYPDYSEDKEFPCGIRRCRRNLDT